MYFLYFINVFIIYFCLYSSNLFSVSLKCTDTRTLCALIKIVWPYEKTKLLTGFFLKRGFNILYKKAKHSNFQYNKLLNRCV